MKDTKYTLELNKRELSVLKVELMIALKAHQKKLKDDGYFDCDLIDNENKHITNLNNFIEDLKQLDK